MSPLAALARATSNAASASITTGSMGCSDSDSAFRDFAIGVQLAVARGETGVRLAAAWKSPVGASSS